MGAGGSGAWLRQMRLLVGRLRRKIHYFTVGTTLALGVNLVSQLEQSCAMSGQCASCGACVPRLLPILGLPLALDATLTLVTKLRSRSAEREATAQQTVLRDRR